MKPMALDYSNQLTKDKTTIDMAEATLAILLEMGIILKLKTCI
jgi:hypothetical protein